MLFFFKIKNIWIVHVHEQEDSFFKMSVLPHSIYKFTVILIKIPARHFVDINKHILKFIWRGK